MSWSASVVVVLMVVMAGGVPLDKFFTFGGGQDSELPKGDDNFSEAISITALRFFDSTYKSLFVSNNGVISFDKGVSQYIPQPFPLKLHKFLAAFWADVDTRANGGGTVYYRESKSQSDLASAKEQIVEVFPSFARDFTVQAVFVATWDRVGYYNQKVDRTNTFQAVLVNGAPKGTFAIFNYASENGIQWTCGTAANVHAQAGFNKGDGETFSTVGASFTEDIVNIGLSSNIDIPGRFIYRIDGGEILPVEKRTDIKNPLHEDNVPEVVEQFNAYDIIYNVGGQFISDIVTHGLKVTVKDPNLMERYKEIPGKLMCAVGPFKTGKSYLLAQICDKPIPAGLMIKTRGISVTLGQNLACVDTEGEHRVDEYKRSRKRKATDRFHQELALEMCDIALIVIDVLSSHKRDYIDNMIELIASLSTGFHPKTPVIIHNFKDFDDIKVVDAFLLDTVLLAYSSESIIDMNGRLQLGGSTMDRKVDLWTFFQHKWVSDHNPKGKKATQLFTVYHLVMAKDGTSAGDLWNRKTIAKLKSLADGLGGNKDLDITSLVEEGASHLLPSYFLATRKEVEDDDSLFSMLIQMQWQKIVTVSTDFIRQQLSLDQDPNNNPFAVSYKPPAPASKVGSLVVKNSDKYSYQMFGLGRDGQPLDSFLVRCQEAQYPAENGKYSIILSCDIPGVELVFNPSGALQIGMVQVRKSVVHGSLTLSIVGVRGADPKMAHVLFATTDTKFFGPFRYDWRLPDLVDLQPLDTKAEYEKCVKYTNGILQVTLPWNTDVPPPAQKEEL